MTNQQAPEIYTLHAVPNKGERPWSGIYTVRADAEHDAKVLRDATGRDWSVVRLVVADTAATPTGPITRYEVVDCIDSKHVPAVIPNGAGPWVRYEDHVAALVEAQQSTPSATVVGQRRSDLVPGVTAPAGAAAILKEILAAACCEDSETYLTNDQYLKLYDLQRRIESMPTQPTHAADSVREDAARLDFLIEQRAYVVSDPDACPGYWLHFVHKETGKCWVQCDEHPTPRAAIDAAIAQNLDWLCDSFGIKGGQHGAD